MVDYEVRGHVAVLTINRPERRNAVDGAVAQGIEDRLDALEADPEVWVGVLTGAGPVFCAGADLRVVSEGRAGELATPRGGFAGIVARARTKPLIAAVDGPAVAGGLEVVLACDLVVASREATFGIPEVKRSLVAAGGGLFRLPQALPRAVALELGLTGDPIGAPRAYELGMVNELTEPGRALEGAIGLAERIAANAPLAVRETLHLMRDLEGVDDEAAFARSAEAFIAVMSTEDFQEGPRAFLEGRPPAWTGR